MVELLVETFGKNPFSRKKREVFVNTGDKKTRAKNMDCCGSAEHGLHRRHFLQGGIATALGVSLGGLLTPYDQAWADALRKKQKHVILLWLAGGSSQLETFDPKPGRPTGGPFRAIPTTTAGVYVSELMPKLAASFQHTAVVRSLDTKIADHGTAAALVETGKTKEAALKHPDLGTVIARELSQRESPVPDYVSLYLATEGHRRPDPGFLGGRYAAMHLNRGLRPENIDLPTGLSESDHEGREHLRRYLSDHFRRSREGSAITGYNSAYARVKGLMRSDALFDLNREPVAVRERFGPTEFGQQALIARRLVESGVPMVKVARAWWDSHSDNFESHRELVSELDHVMTALLSDLHERGLLESTLVVTLSEFGRTPKINKTLGRDHFASAWSFSLSGCGVKGGSVFGKTDVDGQTVADGKVGAAEVAATIYQAVGINPETTYEIGLRPVPIVDEGKHAIKDVLA